MNLHLVETTLQKLPWDNIAQAGLRIPLILGGAWITVKAMKIGLHRLEKHLVDTWAQEGEPNIDHRKRLETVLRLLRQGLSLGIWATALLATLKEMGIDIRPLLTSVGILGLAVGFGAQNLVRDLIAGFFIIIENQLRLGDSATLNNTTGTVERINLRTIVLRDAKGSLFFFPNGAITSLANHTKDWSAYLFNIPLGQIQQAELAIQTAKSAIEKFQSKEEHSAILLENPEIFGVELTGKDLLLKGKIKTAAGKQHALGRELVQDILHALENAGIEVLVQHKTSV